MQFTFVCLLLASTTIGQIAAAPVPIAFQSQWTHLQEREEQATQAQSAAQQQATEQKPQAADSTDTLATTQEIHAVNVQHAQNGVQKADGTQSQNAKDLSIGLGLNIGGGGYSSYSNPYPYGYTNYPGYGCASCCTTCGYAPPVYNSCGGLLSGLVCAVGAILKR